MKKMSIKLRLTLWYTFFMIAIFLIAFGALYYSSRSSTQTTTKNELRNTVNEALEGIEYGSRGLEFDEDIGFFYNGVYLTVYTDNNKENVLYGHNPSRLNIDFDLKLDTFQSQKINDEQWYVYDNARIIKGYGKVWIRGITSFTEAQSAMSNILRWSAIIFPIIIVLIAFLGYLLVKRALSPVNRMINVANDINKGQDLTKRIGLEGTNDDEIHQLSKIFDGMFERLQSSFENEKQFIFDASHELKTPIAVIISQCEDILNRDNLSDEERAETTVLLEQAKKMSRLTAQLLLLSRAEYELHLETINISELVQTIVEDQQAQANEKKIKIEIKIEPNMEMKADETMMMRLFINLISNAITYGKENGLINVVLEKVDEALHGEVADNGIGISAENLPKIWNRFYQVDKSRTVKEGSSMGLGLSMVKWIVEKHKGNIQVESELGEGTRFYFSIPLK